MLAVFRHRLREQFQCFLQPGRSEFFCLVAVCRRRFADARAGWWPFPSTEQRRGFLLVRGRVSDHAANYPLFIATAHLESGSLPENADARQTQLMECVHHLTRLSIPAIFAGDFNLRENELPLRHPHFNQLLTFSDAWVASGCNPQYQFTWTHEEAGHVRARFDRIYTRDLQLLSFYTLPVKCSSTGRRVSDHCALVGTYQMFS